MQPLVFVNVLDAQPNTLVTSTTQIVSTTNAANLTITNGSLVINGTVSLSSTVAVNDQDTVAIQIMSGNLDTPVSTTITSDDGQYFTFNVFAPSFVTAPTLIGVVFTPKIAKFNSTVLSSVIPVSGVTGSISVYGDPILGFTIIKNGTNLHSNTCSLVNGDIIQFSVSTPAIASTNMQYDVGLFFGQSFYTWSIIAQLPFGTPDPFFFTPVADAALDSIIDSNTVTLTGTDVGVSIVATLDVGSILLNGTNVGQSTVVTLNDVIGIEVTSPTTYETPLFCVLTLGTLKYSFGLITLQDPTKLYVLENFAHDNILTYQFPAPADINDNVICSLLDGTTNVNTIDANVTVTNDLFLNDSYIAVTDYYAGTVLILDVLANSIVKTITGFTNPVDVGYSVPDFFNRALTVVADASTKKLNFLDTDTYDLRPEFYQCSSVPYGMSAGFFNTIYVSFGDDTVVKFSVGTYSITPIKTFTFPSGSKPGFIYNDENYIFVPLTVGNKVAVIKSLDDSVQYITIDGNPSSVVSDDGLTYLYIADSYFNEIVRVNYETWDSPFTFYACSYPTQITYYNNSIYVAAFQDNTIYQYDALTQNLVNTTDLPNSCYGLAADGLGEIWAVAFYKNTPNVIGVPDIRVDTGSLTSTNAPVKVNVVDVSTKVSYGSKRRTSVYIPTDYHDASLYEGAINVGQTASNLRSPVTVGLEATTDVDGYDVYVPMLSPGNATLYDVQSLSTTPFPFYFDTTYGAYMRFWYFSNEVTIHGLSPQYECLITVHVPDVLNAHGIAIDFKRIEFYIYVNGVQYPGNNVNVKNGDKLSIAFRAKRYYTNGNSLTIDAGQYTTNWTVDNLNLIGVTDFGKSRSVHNSQTLAMNDVAGTGIYNVNAETFITSVPTFDVSYYVPAPIESLPTYSAAGYSPVITTSAIFTAPYYAPTLVPTEATYTSPPRGYSQTLDSTFAAKTSPRIGVYTPRGFETAYNSKTFVAMSSNVVVPIDVQPSPHLATVRSFAVAYSSVTYTAIKLYELDLPSVSFIGWVFFRPEKHAAKLANYATFIAKPVTVHEIDYTAFASKDLPVGSLTYGSFVSKDLPVGSLTYGSFVSKDLPVGSLTYGSRYPKNLVTHSSSYTNFSYLQSGYTLSYISRDTKLVTNTPTFSNDKRKALLTTPLVYSNIPKTKLATTFASFVHFVTKQIYSDTGYTIFVPKALATESVDYTNFKPKLITNYAIFVGYKPKIHTLNAVYDYTKRKVVTKMAPSFIFFIPYTKYEVGRLSLKVSKYWYSCFQSCLASGMFNSSADALADAIHHGYHASQVQVSTDVHGCWLWSILNKPVFTDKTPIAGWMHGG